MVSGVDSSQSEKIQHSEYIFCAVVVTYFFKPSYHLDIYLLIVMVSQPFTMENNARSTTTDRPPKALASPAIPMPFRPQPSRANKRSASPDWYYDNTISKVARLNMDRETDSVPPVTPPLQANDSLSRRQPQHVRRDTPRPNLNSTNRVETGRYHLKISINSSLNTTATNQQPAAQLRRE